MNEPTKDSECDDFLLGERRVWPRIDTQFTALFMDESGFLREEPVLNLSKGGLFLKTAHLRPKGDCLELILILPDHSLEVTVQGQVQYIRNLGQGLASQSMGMGIMFTAIEPSLKVWLGDFIDRLLDTSGGGKRLNPRVQLTQAPVTLDTAKPDGQKGMATLKNLSPNGLYIETKENLSLFEKLTVCMPHPQTHLNLELRGEVIHLQKLSGNRELYGAGIRFINLDEETKKIVMNLLRDILVKNTTQKTKPVCSH